MVPDARPHSTWFRRIEGVWGGVGDESEDGEGYEEDCEECVCFAETGKREYDA